ncbi:MAG TPA: GlsB/YeaQ/YmgE family stress response membrane protein [Gemmatimonadaceae bacterium]
MLTSICVGIIAGFLAGKIMKGAGYGIIVDLILGLLGGFVGGWIFGMLGIGGGGIIWRIVISTVGAVILVWIAHMVKGNTATTTL